MIVVDSQRPSFSALSDWVSFRLLADSTLTILLGKFSFVPLDRSSEPTAPVPKFFIRIVTPEKVIVRPLPLARLAVSGAYILCLI
jgi:hypothetical protein